MLCVGIGIGIGIEIKKFYSERPIVMVIPIPK